MLEEVEASEAEASEAEAAKEQPGTVEARASPTAGSRERPSPPAELAAEPAEEPGPAGPARAGAGPEAPGPRREPLVIRAAQAAGHDP